MTARVFISYRASDGADKATALARDLDARFGADQVFLDKDDLPAGSRWRDAISSALQDCPVLLVLVTPHYLGAVDAAGKRCIEREDDPTRDELNAGIAAKAHIIPLLCDGVDAMPDGATLPKPFDQLSELQWGRLRAYDWREDLGRIADDLRRLGVAPVEPLAGATQPTTTPMPLADEVVGPSGDTGGGMPARRLALGIAGVAVLAAGGWGVWRWRKQRAADLSGPWSARIGARGAQNSRDGQQVVLVLEQVGRNLKLTSSAVDIQHDPDWENYRDFWKQRNGTELRRVFYRGEGRILGDDEESEDSGDEAASGAAAARAVPVRRVFVGIRIFAPGIDGEPLDGGALHGTIDLDAQRIHGRLWLNSEQAERVVDLRRGG
jgi:hypothetical protein